MRDVERIIRALNSPVRREILAHVWEREMPAGEIAAFFDVTKPTISQHLAVLREAGLVAVRTAGTSRCYRAQPDALVGLYGALDHPDKWSNADGIPERSLAGARTVPAVVVGVDAPVDPGTAFAAFTDAATYSRWLGVPVQIEDGRFSCTLEWGTTVRGRYEVVVPPHLIVMRWDFDERRIPVPGNELTGYLRVTPGPSGSAGSHVEVHQLVDVAEQAEFMEAAWSTVLGRFGAGVASATEPGRSVAPRKARTKGRRSA
jgi:DNA-binding transcriptional ArsR family regulator/uncharacterized protein YndB with AHSA1/START domain